jgi:hypothetical protein
VVAHEERDVVVGSMPWIMHWALGRPMSTSARSSSWSTRRLSMVPCASFTRTSVAPASNAPAIAALVSAVISRCAIG